METGIIILIGIVTLFLILIIFKKKRQNQKQDYLYFRELMGLEENPKIRYIKQNKITGEEQIIK